MDKNLSEPEVMDLHRILIDLKANQTNVDGLGLYDGMMGVCICYFILSEVSNEQRYKKLATKLLSNVQQSIQAVDDLGFAKGLAGIGWGVEWLVRNGFVDANTDVILEEIDDTLYQSVVYSKDVSLSLATGSIGKAMYFLSRYEAKNPHRNRYKLICNLECLVLLSDEISEKLFDENAGILIKSPLKITDSELQEIGQSLILMLRLNDKKINTQTAIEALRAIILFSEKYILMHSKKELALYKGKGISHLIYAYMFAGEILGKQSFTEDSGAVHNYLAQVGFTTETIVDLNIKEILNLFDASNEKNIIPGNKFLNMLKDINSLKNATYGYEAFMLK